MSRGASNWTPALWTAAWLVVAVLVWMWAWPQQVARGCWMGEWPFEAGCSAMPAGRTQDVEPTVLQAHLRRNPGDSHAYARLLAMWWLQGNPAAQALLPTVRQLAPFDPQSLAVRAEAAIAQGDAPLAVEALVAMVERGNLRARAPLVQLMLMPQTQPAVLDAIQPGKRWVGTVLNGLDSSVPVSALQPVIARGLEVGVLKPATVLAMVDRLKREGNWLDAYTLWVAWNGQVEEGLFNGGFDQRVLRRGFDWEWKDQPGGLQGVRISQVSAAPRPGWMLELEATGRAALPTPLVSQTLVLLRQRYELTGRWMADRLRTRDGLVWAVRCLAGGERIAQSTALRDTQRQWQTFSMEVMVPPTCAGAVRLQLETANPAEARMGMTGVINVDDLVLKPMAENRP